MMRAPAARRIVGAGRPAGRAAFGRLRAAALRQCLALGGISAGGARYVIRGVQQQQQQQQCECTNMERNLPVEIKDRLNKGMCRYM